MKFNKSGALSTNRNKKKQKLKRFEFVSCPSLSTNFYEEKENVRDCSIIRGLTLFISVNA